MCSTLVSNNTPGLHFYTLNLERSVLCILDSGGYSSGAALRRQYPWRASTEAKRAGKQLLLYSITDLMLVAERVVYVTLSCIYHSVHEVLMCS
jgi:hypothetical protein